MGDFGAYALFIADQQEKSSNEKMAIFQFSQKPFREFIKDIIVTW